MYVEVSGRQTGKTTRLVDNVITFLTENPDKSALIVAWNNDMRKRIQKRVRDKCGRRCEHRTITSYKMLEPVPNGSIKQFVDEFWFINHENLVIDPNAYYTSTIIGDTLNPKASQIIEYYKYQKNPLKPNNVLKKHKL